MYKIQISEFISLFLIHSRDIPDRRYLKKNDPIADTFGPLKSIVGDFFFLLVSEELDELERGITENVVPLPYLSPLKLRQEEMLVDLLDDDYVEDHAISID